MKKIIPNIEFKSVLTGLSIKERNHVFNNELTEEGQRLEIAWDGLQLVIKDILNPHTHGYWSNNLKNKLSLLNPKQTQKTLLQNNEIKELHCRVCQRGLMMISQIRLGNQLCMTTNNDIDSGFGENIRKGFSYFSFRQMENEYEQSFYRHPYPRHTREKLANICCNVLVNGDFNIDDKTNYLIIE